MEHTMKEVIYKKALCGHCWIPIKYLRNWTLVTFNFTTCYILRISKEELRLTKISLLLKLNILI